MELSEQALYRLSSQHKLIKSYLHDLPAEAINKKEITDQESIHEIIACIYSNQYAFINCITAITTHVAPLIEIYKADTDSQKSFILAKTNRSLLREIYRLRKDIIFMLQRLPANQASRIGIHPVLGKMNLCQWLEIFLLYECRQLFKIFKIACIIRISESSYDHVRYMPWMRRNN